MNEDDEFSVRDKRWHLDKRVNLSHIVATLILASSMFAWGNAIDKRVAVLETHQTQQDKDNARQDIAANETLRLLREDMRELRGEVVRLREAIDNRARDRR